MSSFYKAFYGTPQPYSPPVWAKGLSVIPKTRVKVLNASNDANYKGHLLNVFFLLTVSSIAHPYPFMASTGTT